MPSYTEQFGRTLIIFGVVIIVVGVALTFARNLRFGTLPGDFSWSGRGWQIWLPLGSSILLSLILTVVLNLLFRRR